MKAPGTQQIYIAQATSRPAVRRVSLLLLKEDNVESATKMRRLNKQPVTGTTCQMQTRGGWIEQRGRDLVIPWRTAGRCDHLPFFFSLASPRPLRRQK